MQVVKPFLEPKTANKVKFVYSDDLNSKKIMEDLFDMEHLEFAFGGNDSMGFDINKYAERMREDDKKIPAFWTREHPALTAPQPSLPCALDSINLNSVSVSDASDDEKTDCSPSLQVESEAVSPGENMVATNGSKHAI